jgi:hypothetical protein
MTAHVSDLDRGLRNKGMTWKERERKQRNAGMHTLYRGWQHAVQDCKVVSRYRTVVPGKRYKRCTVIQGVAAYGYSSCGVVQELIAFDGLGAMWAQEWNGSVQCDKGEKRATNE